MKKNVFMFSGQGSQFYNMGESLYYGNKNYREIVKLIDKYVFEMIGIHLLEILYDPSKSRNEPFDYLKYTHPSIFMVEYSIAKMMMSYGILPDYVLGTSLGELVALCISGVISLKDAVKATIEQADLFQKKCPTGGMISVIGADYDIAKNDIFSDTELAGVNYKGHFVISGMADTMSDVERRLKDNSIPYARLPVSYPFHSSYIESLRSDFMKLASKIKINYPNISVISCVYGKEMSSIEHEYFWNVVRRPILYSDAVDYLESLGDEYNYIDLSIGGALAGFTKRILSKKSKSDIIAIETPFTKANNNLNGIIEKLETKNIKKENKNMIAYVFPGQGAQFVGMGMELFAEFPEYVRIADKVLGYSIEELCLSDPNNLLNQTEYTQPALYIVNCLYYLNKIKEINCKPDYVAGHSLGEYNALLASGAIDFETGLKLVKKRGELMQKAKGGAMAAIIGADIESVSEIIKVYLPDVNLANINCPSQIVISGREEDIDAAEEIFTSKLICRFKKLNVSGAFHSHYMTQASREFAEYIKDINFNKMEIPVISNYTARPYTHDKIKEYLEMQINHSVKWSDSMRFIMGRGDVEIIQCGYGMVLTNLQRKIQKETTPDISSYHVDINRGYKASEEQVFAPEKVVKFGSSLGNPGLKKLYNLKYAYMVGGMYRGVTSKEMVVSLGKNGMIGFLGTGGVKLDDIGKQIDYIQNNLAYNEAYGVNLVYAIGKEEREKALFDMLLKKNVRNVELAAYMSVSKAVLYYKAKGMKKKDGKICSENVIMAKLSRPEVAEEFCSPASEEALSELFEADLITRDQMEMMSKVPVADVICVESDSGGHTDQAVAIVAFPAICMLRDRICQKYNYDVPIYIGAAGGIGAPAAAAAMFVMGADFILTGSINQCTVESGMNENVKEMLQNVNVQDTDYAPAGDMFEMNAKVQVMKKGVFFPARANKLHELYDIYDSWEQIDAETRNKIETRYFKKSFSEILEYVKQHYSGNQFKQNMNDKQKLAAVFKWYINNCSKAALEGRMNEKVNFQVHCGPAMGVFNQWVKGTELENWRNRKVAEIGERLMEETAVYLQKSLDKFKH